MSEKLLTLNEIAEKLRVSRHTVQAWISPSSPNHKPEFANMARHAGRKTVFIEDEIETWLNQRKGAIYSQEFIETSAYWREKFISARGTISNAVIMGINNNVGFIRYATGGASIHDMVIDGSFTGSAKIGGVIGFVRDGGEVLLTNVINRANVRATGSSDANAAGLFGCAVDNTKVTVTNCANMGEVKGQDGNCAAFAGWTQTGTTFTNCWNSGAIYNIEGSAQLYRNTGAVTATNCFDLTNVGNQGTKVDASTLATGELCYELNGDQSDIHWYQNLSGTMDAYPVPFDSHAQLS